jgi:DNA repair exonuclease SbcCD ATPase subunit
MEAITRPKRDPIVDAERAKSEDLKRLEAKLEEIARQPRENTKQLRDRVKDMTPLEDEIKKLERERGEKSKLLQQQLQMKDQITPNDGAQQEGPAKEFMKALAEGDMESAREQMDKLAKKIAKNELTEQDKQQLAKQLNNLQKKMNDLANQKSKEEMLKKLGEDGKLDSEALERELSQMRQENEKLKDLQKLANKLNQCQQCVKAGDTAGAQKAMGQAADQIGDMARDDKELNDLRDALQNLKDARDAMTKALDEVEPCPGGT